MLQRLKIWQRYTRRNMRFGGEGGYAEIWRVAYPLMIMNASHTFMQVCDRKFLSYHSTMEVAAALPAGILAFQKTGGSHGACVKMVFLNLDAESLKLLRKLAGGSLAAVGKE